jgi:hypothetical protein
MHFSSAMAVSIDMIARSVRRERSLNCSAAHILQIAAIANRTGSHQGDGRLKIMLEIGRVSAEQMRRQAWQRRPLRVVARQMLKSLFEPAFPQSDKRGADMISHVLGNLLWLDPAWMIHLSPLPVSTLSYNPRLSRRTGRRIGVERRLSTSFAVDHAPNMERSRGMGH